MIRISHPTGIVKASVQLPASKSISNRVLVLQYLSGIKIPVTNLSTANDTILLQSILSDVSSVVDVADAGTAFRFLTAALCTKNGKYLLTGTERLRQRPIHILVNALQRLGAAISYTEKEGFAPLIIEGKSLSGGELEVDATISSQFVSALLMIAPVLKNGLVLKLKGIPVSLPYIKMTLQLMEHFGVKHQWEQNTIRISPQQYQANEYMVEADWSAASYWFEIASCAREAEIRLLGLGQSSLQGDSVIVSMMKQFGVKTEIDGDDLLLTKNADFDLPLSFYADCLATPDIVPTLVAVCAALEIKAKVDGVDMLNEKESKRKNVLVDELRHNGIDIVPKPNSINLIRGRLVQNAVFNTHNDHRMAMSFAPLCLRTTSVTIDNSEVVKKSYPDYWAHIQNAGFIIEKPD